MSKETFWVVQWRYNRGRWKSFVGLFHPTRKVAIRYLRDLRGGDWSIARKELRCIKVRVVAVEDGK